MCVLGFWPLLVSAGREFEASARKVGCVEQGGLVVKPDYHW